MFANVQEFVQDKNGEKALASCAEVVAGSKLP